MLVADGNFEASLFKETKVTHGQNHWPLYWVFYKDPYNGLLQSLYITGVIKSPVYTKKDGFSSLSENISTLQCGGPSRPFIHFMKWFVIFDLRGTIFPSSLTHRAYISFRLSKDWQQNCKKKMVAHINDRWWGCTLQLILGWLNLEDHPVSVSG